MAIFNSYVVNLALVCIGFISFPGCTGGPWESSSNGCRAIEGFGGCQQATIDLPGK